MSEWKWSVFNAAICAFEVYIFHFFIEHMLEKQPASVKERRHECAVLIALWMYILFVNQCSDALMGKIVNIDEINKLLFTLFKLQNLTNLFMNLLLIPFGLFITCHILYRGQISRTITLTFVFYAISTITEIAGGLIGEKQLNLQEYDFWPTVFLVVVEKFITFVFIRLLVKFRSHYEKVDKKLFALFMFLPVATLLMNLGILFVTLASPQVIENKTWFIIGDGFLLIANGAVFYIYEKHLETLKKVQIQQLKTLKSSFHEKYYQSLADKNAKYASLAHDYKNQMRAIQILAGEGNTAIILELVEDILGQNSKIQEFTNYCNNDILNALLCANAESAKCKGIDFSIDIQPGFGCAGISDFDICSIFGNLLENALEAAEKCKENRFVRCVFYYRDCGKIIHASIINSYVPGTLKKEKEKLLTSKKDTTSHGIGLKNVRDTVENVYDGIFTYDSSDDGIFTVNLILTL